MNAYAPITELILRDPVRRQAQQLYAAILPQCIATTSPVVRDQEAAAARHTLHLTLRMAAVAASRANQPKIQALLETLVEGDQWAGVYACSGDDDDLSMVEATGADLMGAAEDIALNVWGV